MSADAAARVVDESAGDVGALYEEHVRMLVGIATKRYHIAESDAEGLAHDVFVSYLMRSREIHDSRAWLFGAICNASKFFLRMKARHVPLSPAIAEEPDPTLERIGDALPDQLAARQAVCFLTARCQLALRLRYLEGYTVPEIATEFGTSPRYATKLVAQCLRQAHFRYARGTA